MLERGSRPGVQPGGWYQNGGFTDAGNSNRNRPGSNAGNSRSGNGTKLGNDLFDDQGRPKLPYNGSASRNDPPGMRNGEIREIDRAGTWRKRRPTDLDASDGGFVFIPHEDVLQELVRRGIKTTTIKLPNGKSIKCVVSLMQLMGGCGMSDANLQDQEAVARPPPKVPFKPELNQHNGGRTTEEPAEKDHGPGAIQSGQQIGSGLLTPQKQPEKDPKKPQFNFKP